MSPPPLTTLSLRQLLLVGIIALIAASAIAANGLISRARIQQDLVQWTNAQATPTVTLAKLAHGDDQQKLILPGNIQPYRKAAIYARVSGYLKSWDTDIGARVMPNDVLATIETPDLDQQLAQARANWASAKANYHIAAITAERDKDLLQKQAVSQQIADQTAADAEAKKAIMDADEAYVGQLEAMQSFKQLLAPFDGIVTARNTDIGALINSGSGGQPLFEGGTHRELVSGGVGCVHCQVNSQRVFSRDSRLCKLIIIRPAPAKERWRLTQPPFYRRPGSSSGCIPGTCRD